MSTKTKLRLGTRPSLLAVAQSRLVARELELKHPEISIELVEVRTRGDKDLETPLTRINDPGFFAAELDEALLDGTVDFCVHSYKDLDRNRPAGLTLAAVAKRENPRDAVLFGEGVIDKLSRGEPLRIGSSSLRRQINIGEFLPRALPNDGKPADIEFHPLRGPVHERLARICEGAGEKRLDGVVLALAGLARLWNDTDGRAVIAPMLADARWMVLPLAECPAAAGQGALAVECRAADARTLEILQGLHDADSAAQVEREVVAVGRHAKGFETGVGATTSLLQKTGFITHVRGRAGDCLVATTESELAAKPRSKNVRAWTGADWNRYTRRRSLEVDLPGSGAVFAAHWHALDGRQPDPALRCWTSGTTSWSRLAEQGIWVEGCADNLGFDAIISTLSCPVLQLPELQTWTALTHADAVGSWRCSGIDKVLATYTAAIDTADPAKLNERLRSCTHFYWSSARQYESLKAWVPDGAHHACGPGKTLAALKDAGLNEVQTFASRREWQQWLA